ncbi:MAG: hypothetical protein ACYDFT_06855, partial [Thermoplasmata archaeon]
NETGLPAGTPWWVNLTNGQSSESNGSQLSLNETNGSYAYALGTSLKIYAAPSGSFAVDGASVSEDVEFSPYTYSVAFVETGLPSAVSWWVNLTNGHSFESTDSQISFNETNGSYSYALGTSLKTFFGPSGTFTIGGAKLTHDVVFSRYTYVTTFGETGLPTGALWWVNLTNGQSLHSTGSTLIFNETNGTYGYGIATMWKTFAAPPGSFAVVGANVSHDVAFSPYTYSISFVETGLPSGTPWWVNLTNGQSGESTGTQVSLNETNGTYLYAIGTSLKTQFAPSGSLGVGGTMVTLDIRFSPYTYSVVFDETGLPPGAQWWVNLTNGQSYESTGGRLSLNETNGTYPYALGTSRKMYDAPPGLFMIEGANRSIDVLYSPFTYLISFDETGLPTGTSWWVNLTNGQSSESTGSSIIFHESNGSFAFGIGSARAGYVATNGLFTVDGATRSVPVAFVVVVYVVTFAEQGLPVGTAWWINLAAGGRNETNGSAVSFKVPNGTYFYGVASVAKELGAPGGSIEVAGHAANVTISFVPVRYTVNFVETGLPSATPWTMTLSGAILGSISNAISYAVTDASYAFTVGGVHGYFVDPSSGTVRVNGSNETISVNFQRSGASSALGKLSLPGIALVGVVLGIFAVTMVALLLSRRRSPVAGPGAGAAPPPPWQAQPADCLGRSGVHP